MMKEKKDVPSFDRVPDEIQREILSRLPVKSLLRFKCVTKSWHDLIDDAAFVAMHLSNRSKQDDGYLLSKSFDKYSHHQHFRPYHRGGNYGKTCSFELLISKKSLFGVDFGQYMIGSTNGLICLSNFLNAWMYDSLRIRVWNPWTRRIFEVPRFKDDADSFVIGFGFCKKFNDYRVVKVLELESLRYKYSEVQVYSLNKKSWEAMKKENPGWTLRNSEYGDWFFDGAFHWLGQERVSSRKVIVSFRFDDEVLCEINLPKRLNFEADEQFCAGVFAIEYRNSFSLIVTDKWYGLVHDVWVMKEYGVSDSWVKQFTIKTPIWHLPVMSFENNGELHFLLLDNNSRVVWYNTKTKKIEEQPEFSFQGSVMGLFRCKESLVSW